MALSAGPLKEIEWKSPVASAQVKSAILLAALFGGVRARVTEPHLSRDHTERMLLARGIALNRELGGMAVELPAGQVLRPVDVAVPGDPSSAAFFLALGLLADEGSLKLENVCLNETRSGFVNALKRMRALIDIRDGREEGGEHVGTLIPRPSSRAPIEQTSPRARSSPDRHTATHCGSAPRTRRRIRRGRGL